MEEKKCLKLSSIGFLYSSFKTKFVTRTA